jgi:aldehyde oxidoreductase
MIDFSFYLNGISKRIFVDPNRRLIDVIREDFMLTGTKRGCGRGICGACSVIMDGKVIRSCRIPMEKVREGSRIITIEGLGTLENPHPIQSAFVYSGAVQCGFCIPGMIIRTKALLDINPAPTAEEIKKAFQGYLCRCTGYKKIIDAVLLSSKLLRGELSLRNLYPDLSNGVIGVSLPRPDAFEKTTGATQYIDDIPFNGAAHLIVVRSPHSHAVIKSINISEAERMPGVIGIVLASDIKGSNRVKEQLKEVKKPIEDWPILCEHKVRTIGDPVAIVGAESPEQASEAASKVTVEYEVLPALLSVKEALSENSPHIHDQVANSFYNAKIVKGDAENGLKNSYIVVEGEFSTPCLAHAHIEPDGAVAFFDQQERISIYGRSCGIHRHVKPLGVALGVDEDGIRYIQTPSGGHFGAKLEVSAEGLAGAAALKFRRPTRLIYSMEETFLCNIKRQPFVMKMRLGAEKDGRLHALLADIIVGKGPYNSASGKPTLTRALQQITGAYRIPDVGGFAQVVFTNNATGGAMRGPGSIQPNFAIESMMDLLADKMGIDPLEIRIMNALRDGDSTSTGQIVSDMPYLECLETLRPYYLKAKEQARAKSTKEGRRGIGIAGAMYGIGYSSRPRDTSEVWVELTQNGYLDVYAGVADHGQGDIVMLVQIASHASGFPPEKIHLINTDSSRTPDSGASTGSRQTYMSGQALFKAIETMNRAMEENSAYKYDDLVQKGLPVKYHGIKIQDTTAADPETLQGNPYETWGVGVQMAEVEVDIDKGDVHLLKMTAVGDPGTVINPQAVEGQFEGGMMMGAGMALTEEYIHNKSLNFGKYRIPDFKDYFEMEVILNQTYRGKGPFGATGVGEFVMLPTAPAIANAVSNACGVRVLDLPITKDKILRGLKKT